MKSAQITPILMGITAFCVVGTIACYIVSTNRAKQISRLQPMVARVQQSNIAVNSLLAELTEYSKRDPQIKPLLQSVMQPVQAQPQPAAK